MNVLSLFDGMSCGQLALEKANIQVDSYLASEIDKFAIQVAVKNYPTTQELGDITQITASQLPHIDLLIGGSPCQGFSFAGKQLNFEDHRSKLFFEFVRLLESCNPKHFLLENVQMKQEYQDVISKYLGVKPISINSRLFSAQNRPRLYWTNIPNISIPTNDHPSTIKDILENNVSDSYNISDQRKILIDNGSFKQTGRIFNLNEKCCTLTAGMGMGGGVTPKIYENDRIRYITPLECERLQTVPDNYTDIVSKTQRYKMLGNGWTIDVIAHIFKGLI